MQKEVESVTSGAQEPLQAGEGGRGDEGRFPGLFLPLGATPASAAGPPGRRISPSHQADLLPGTLTGQLSAFFFFSPLLAPPAPTSDSQNSPPLIPGKGWCNFVTKSPPIPLITVYAPLPLLVSFTAVRLQRMRDQARLAWDSPGITELFLPTAGCQPSGGSGT